MPQQIKIQGQQFQQKYWMPEKYDECKIPKVIQTIRQRKQNLLRDSRIAELSKKYQFDKYAFSRLMDNKSFDYTRTYLASIHLNNFRNYKTKSKISDEIWLRNQNLPTGDSLFQLCI